MIKASEILNIISKEIEEWHRCAANRPDDYIIVNDNMRRIRPLNEHRDDMVPVVKELINTNCEMCYYSAGGRKKTGEFKKCCSFFRI